MKGVNVCEHGDHEAPEGQRFCSEACKECEIAAALAGHECAGICLRYRRTTRATRPERVVRVILPAKGLDGSTIPFQRVQLHGAQLERAGKKLPDTDEGQKLLLRDVDRRARIDAKKPRLLRAHERATKEREREAKRAAAADAVAAKLGLQRATDDDSADPSAPAPEETK